MVASTTCLRGKTEVPSFHVRLALSFSPSPSVRRGEEQTQRTRRNSKKKCAPPSLPALSCAVSCVNVVFPVNLSSLSPPLSLCLSLLFELFSVGMPFLWCFLALPPPFSFFRCISLYFSISLSLTQTRMSFRCLTSVEPGASVAETFPPPTHL